MSSGYEIQVLGSGETFTCRSDESVLTGMVRLGRKSIPAGCRGGGCGVCKIHVKSGEYRFKKMSRAHISEDEEKRGFALACRCYPSGHLHVDVVGAMKTKGFV